MSAWTLNNYYSGQLLLVKSLFATAQAAGMFTATIGKSGAAYIQDLGKASFFVDENTVAPRSLVTELQAAGFALPTNIVNGHSGTDAVTLAAANGALTARAGYVTFVLDLKHKIETRVTRDDLYRIGNFTDWFDLAHGLRYPQGDYRLTALSPTRVQQLATSVACRWYLLEQGTTSTRICWSVRERLPVAILDDRDRWLWKLSDVSRTPAPKDVFEVRDQGYVRNDASGDISGD